MSSETLLSEQEFDELDKFLLSERCGGDTMALDALHGYLTALEIGPRLPEQDWLAPIWGPPGSPKPSFKSATESARIMSLIERMRADIRLTMEVAPNDFEPLFCEYKSQGKKVLDAEAWAWGFWEAVMLNRSAWQALLDSASAELLRPMYLFGAEQIEDAETVLVDDPAKCHQLALQIETALPLIYRFWRDDH